MPTPLAYSHEILRRIAADRKDGSVKGLEPDSKSQISMLYQDGKPVKATSVVVSSQHQEDFTGNDLSEYVRGVVEDVLHEGWI